MHFKHIYAVVTTKHICFLSHHMESWTLKSRLFASQLAALRLTDILFCCCLSLLPSKIKFSHNGLVFIMGSLAQLDQLDR